MARSSTSAYVLVISLGITVLLAAIFISYARPTFLQHTTHFFSSTNLVSVLLISLSTGGAMMFFYKNKYLELLKDHRKLKQELLASEQKNNSLEAANAIIDDYATAISHDLKEPLRNIGAFTNLLKRKEQDILSSESKEYIDYVLHATENMDQLLNDLTTYSNLNKAPKEEKVPLDMDLVFTKWIRDHQDLIQEHDASIELSQLPAVCAYPSLVKVLVDQLLRNGLKFHKENSSAKIKISASSNYKQHTFLIEDNGIGFNPNFKKQIFQLFQRLEKQQFKGSGIGLSLCQRVIEHHRGKIWVETEEGIGSKFYFSLPKTQMATQQKTKGFTPEEVKPFDLALEC